MIKPKNYWVGIKHQSLTHSLTIDIAISHKIIENDIFSIENDLIFTLYFTFDISVLTHVYNIIINETVLQLYLYKINNNN